MSSTVDAKMATAEHKEAIESGRWELLHHLQELLEKPMIGLSIIWVGLIILSFTSGLSRMLVAGEGFAPHA